VQLTHWCTFACVCLSSDGLSYSRFNFSRMVVAPPNHLNPDIVTTVSVHLVNSGRVPGTEVVQVYCAAAPCATRD
jgi:hypothetical protein